METSLQLKRLFEQTFNQDVIEIERLPRSASYREYYRITSKNLSVIGTYNPNYKENLSFLYMSEYFYNKNLPVPKIYAKDMEKNIYLQQDLGNQTLLNHIKTLPQEEDVIFLLKQVLDYLIKFQTSTDNDFDWTKCYPVAKFDKTAYSFDLNYFKYMVLRILKAQFNELELEKEFLNIIDFILHTDHNYFVYRDFQTRNIMWYDNKMFFIDYQGGRQGSIFYDLVSLLYDTKLNLTAEQKELLKNYFFNKSFQLHKLSQNEFDAYFKVFALIRKLQALAAYSFRGIVENKLIFILGLEKAFSDVFHIINDDFPLDLPELKSALIQAYENIPFKHKRLNVSIEINSFSFLQQGYPSDQDGNGGGFVFDCRFLPNPVYIEKYKYLTGLDEPVQQWLEAQPQFEDFIVNVFRMIYNALIEYENKGYTHLQVNFGCTGGRHRSVYSAEKLASLLKNFLDIPITINHLMKENWKFLK